MSDATVTVRLRTDAARLRLKAAILRATTVVFETDIKEQAVQNSPVSEQWPSIPESRGEPRIDTGLNRNSINTEVNEVENGVEAKIFTESGHGGYLEVGTSKMPARPYIAPAVLDNAKKIAIEVKKILG